MAKQHSYHQSLLNLNLLLGIFALALYALGLFNQLKLCLIIPIIFGLIIYFFSTNPIHLAFRYPNLSTTTTTLLLLLFSQFFIYSWGLFVPETGFDALWYHLPQAQVYAATGQISAIPSLIYSTLPRLGEMFFTAGYLFSSPFLVKSISFFFTLLFSLMSYSFSRQFLNRQSSLLATLTINSSLVIAWQATSGYVDIIRAVFETGSLLSLVFWSKSPHIKSSRHLIQSGILAGLALSVKPQALISIFASLIFIAATILPSTSTKTKTLPHILFLFFLPAILVAFPWYLDNWVSAGHPLYPLNLSSKQLDQFSYAAAVNSLPAWIIHQLSRLPAIFFHLTFTGSGILTPALLILLPIAIFQLKKLITFHSPLLFYALSFLLLWWFLPPPETRYLLGALPPLITLFIIALKNLSPSKDAIKSTAVTVLLLSVLLNLSARTYASTKYLPVIFNQQSPIEYLQTQTTSFNQELIDKFHSDYWLKYRYNH